LFQIYTTDNDTKEYTVKFTFSPILHTLTVMTGLMYKRRGAQGKVARRLVRQGAKEAIYLQIIITYPDKCLLCDQEDENIQHLLIGCVVARQFWYSLLHSIGLSQLSPAVNDSPFDAWWERVAAAVTGDVQRGLNSLIILGAWCIWKHRNNCVFNGASPSVASMLSMARDEAHLWTLAGAKGLASLSVRVVG